MDYNELSNLGFDSTQINQILKMDGKFNISKLEITDDATLLRRLNQIIKEVPKNKQLYNLALKGLRENIDIYDWYNNGITYVNKLKVMLSVAEKGLDVSGFKNEFSIDEFKMIADYKMRGYDIEKYVEKKYNENLINDIIDAKELGLDIEKLLEDGFSIGQVHVIMFATEKKIDILKYVDKTFDARQMEGILESIEMFNANNIKEGTKKFNDNLIKIKNKNYSKSIIKIVANGLIDNLDITSYLNKYDTRMTAHCKLEVLRAGKDPNKVNGYDNIKPDLLIKAIVSDVDLNFVVENPQTANIIVKFIIDNPESVYNDLLKNPKITPLQIKCFIDLYQKEKEDVRLISEEYNDAQTKFIYNCLKKDIDITSICNSIIPVETMKAIIECEQFGIKVDVSEIDKGR